MAKIKIVIPAGVFGGYVEIDDQRVPDVFAVRFEAGVDEPPRVWLGVRGSVDLEAEVVDVTTLNDAVRTFRKDREG